MNRTLGELQRALVRRGDNVASSDDEETDCTQKHSTHEPQTHGETRDRKMNRGQKEITSLAKIIERLV